MLVIGSLGSLQIGFFSPEGFGCRAIGTLHRLGGTMEIFVGKERNLLFGSTSKSLKMTNVSAKIAKVLNQAGP